MNQLVERLEETALAVPNDIDALPDDTVPNVEALIADYLTEVGDEVQDKIKIQVWRVNPRQYTDKAFLIEMLPPEFSIQRIAEDYGGGLYQAVVRAPRMNGKTGVIDGRATVIVKAHRFKIVGAEREPVRRPADALQGQVLPAQNPADIAKVMMDGFREIMMELKNAQQRPPEKTTMEMLLEIEKIKGIFTPAPLPAGPDPLQAALAQFTLLEKIKEVMAPAAAPAASGSEFMQLAQLIAPAISAAVQKEKGVVPAGAPNPALVPPVAETEMPETPAPLEAEAAAPINPEDDPVNLMAQAQALMFKAYVKKLTVQARANNDVEPTAQEIYEQAPDELWEFLQASDWLTKLAEIDKDVKLFPGWFEKLHARLMAIDAEPDTVAKKEA